jgi:hypothetical protein
MEVLPLALISNSDVQIAVKRLRPSKSVCHEGIPTFVMMSCADTFLPVHRIIFNFRLSQNTFPKVCK